MSGKRGKKSKNQTKKIVYLIDYQIDDGIFIENEATYFANLENQSLALIIKTVPAIIIAKDINSA
jgi:hypothetical protein